MALLEPGLPALEGLPVDRTDVLAYIAPENPVADQGSQITRYCPPALDGEVGDAAGVVDHKGGYNGAGGAVVDAQARAAIVALIDKLATLAIFPDD